MSIFLIKKTPTRNHVGVFIYLKLRTHPPIRLIMYPV